MDKVVPFTEGEAASTMRSIIGIVGACHKKGIIVHVDLKPENILFQTSDKNEVMKCIDLGCSKFFELGQVFTDIVGTLSFAAPEVLKGCYGPEADIWSAGVILYEMLSGVPLSGVETKGALLEIGNGNSPSLVNDPLQNISEGAKDLVRKILDHDPRKRPSASNVLEHPWMNL